MAGTFSCGLDATSIAQVRAEGNHDVSLVSIAPVPGWRGSTLLTA